MNSLRIKVIFVRLSCLPTEPSHCGISIESNLLPGSLKVTTAAPAEVASITRKSPPFPRDNIDIKAYRMKNLRTLQVELEIVATDDMLGVHHHDQSVVLNLLKVFHIFHGECISINWRITNFIFEMTKNPVLLFKKFSLPSPNTAAAPIWQN